MLESVDVGSERNSIYVRQWFTRRPLYGNDEQLLHELNREAPKWYKNFIRVNADLFGESIDFHTELRKGAPTAGNSVLDYPRSPNIYTINIRYKIS